MSANDPQGLGRIETAADGSKKRLADFTVEDWKALECRLKDEALELLLKNTARIDGDPDADALEEERGQ